MYRRYYRYNDPAPGTRRPTSVQQPAPAAAPPEPKPTPKPTTLPFSFERLLGDAARDDLILVGLLLLVLLGEDKKEIDLPLVLALLYLLIGK